MSDFDRPGATLQDPVKQRPRGSRFANLGDRLARTFGSYDRDLEETNDWEAPDGFGYDDQADPPTWDPVGPRFPLSRLGYDRDAVDDHIVELERELAALQTRAPSGDAVSAEIEKIGEQTSAILTVAHDKAQEMTRQAQEQADRCLADAASNAVMITEEAKRLLRQLDSDTDAVWRERARLIEDVRGVAGALAALADDAVSRFPAEPERSDREPPEPSGPRPLAAESEPSGPRPLAADSDPSGPRPLAAEPDPSGPAAFEPGRNGPARFEPAPPAPDHEATMQMASLPEDEQPWFGT